MKNFIAVLLICGLLVSTTMSQAEASEIVDRQTGTILYPSDLPLVRGVPDKASFTSDRYSTGVDGYDFEISFNWVEGTNLKGEPVIDLVTDFEITTYEDWFLLSLTWDDYEYEITDEYLRLENNQKLVTFYVEYTFQLQDQGGTWHTDVRTIRDTLTLEELL